MADASILCAELREKTGVADAGFVVGAAVINTAGRTIKVTKRTALIIRAPPLLTATLLSCHFHHRHLSFTC